jgi:hypothetical protein
VPVFRYALENWPPQVYELEVVLRGPVAPKVQADLYALQAYLDKSPINVQLTRSDHARLRQSFGAAGAPMMVLRFPKSSGLSAVLHEGPLDADVLKKILDSPVRRSIAQRLLKGDSAVWIIADSGDKAKDDASYARLQQCLTVQEKTLELPKLTESPKDKLRTREIELKVAFSILRLAPDDPEEEFLRRLLRHTEVDLADRREPMAFPVFGQGKVLYALIGKGINEETIAQAAQFLIGKCKCEVQDENPGVSLLMTADWEAGLEGRLTAAPKLPPLTGLLRPGSGESKAEQPSREQRSSGFGLLTNMLLMGGVGVIGLIIVSWFLLRKS